MRNRRYWLTVVGLATLAGVVSWFWDEIPRRNGRVPNPLAVDYGVPRVRVLKGIGVALHDHAASGTAISLNDLLDEVVPAGVDKPPQPLRALAQCDDLDGRYLYLSDGVQVPHGIIIVVERTVGPDGTQYGLDTQGFVHRLAATERAAVQRYLGQRSRRPATQQ